MGLTNRLVRRRLVSIVVVGTAAVAASRSFATDIEGVLPGALDQPRVNVLLRRSPTGPIIHFDANDPAQYIFNAFLDTGASGHLLSNETAGYVDTDLSDGDDSEPGLEIARDASTGPQTVFEDVGGGGAVQFNVSEQLYMQLASHNQNTALSIPGDPDFRPALSDFGPVSGPVRTQIGPVLRPVEGDPLRNLDVIGMPAMVGKVVVMDNRGLNKFASTQDLNDFDVLDTFVYNPGTPFDPDDAAEPQASVNPGIPSVQRHIALSYANFDAFSHTTPANAPGPSLAHNPFVGRDPVRLADGVSQPNVPGIKVTRGTSSLNGNFLLDTGAGASFLSRGNAQLLGVEYQSGHEPGDPSNSADPILIDSVTHKPIEDQFTVSIAAFGADDPNDPNDSSAIKISGFYLDSMLVRSAEGNAANDADPNHFNFIGAPVLVFDVSVLRELPGGGTQSIVLDGVLGMNFFAASAVPIESIFEPLITAPGAFDWLVYDEAAGTLGVTLAPEPTAAVLTLAAAGVGLMRRGRRGVAAL